MPHGLPSSLFSFVGSFSLVAFCDLVNVIGKHVEFEQVFVNLLLPPLVLGANRCKTLRESAYED